MRTWIEPVWPAPTRVRAASTLRHGGASAGPFASFNLADHVGDDPATVNSNRTRLSGDLGLPSAPLWLHQVHGNHVIEVGEEDDGFDADGSWTSMSNRVCAVMTADCLPVLLCSTDGSRVAAVHGGWRGLASGILRVAVDRMGPGPIMAWLGPAIGPEAFEVGPEVREAFIGTGDYLADAFRPAGGSKWTADIYEIARQQLAALGVKECYGGEYCTYGDPDRFFSYRRDGVTGRMATLIWKV